MPESADPSGEADGSLKWSEPSHIGIATPRIPKDVLNQAKSQDASNYKPVIPGAEEWRLPGASEVTGVDLGKPSHRSIPTPRIPKDVLNQATPCDASNHTIHNRMKRPRDPG